MSHPAYKPLLRFVLRIRLQKGGRICGTLRYVVVSTTAYITTVQRTTVPTAVCVAALGYVFGGGSNIQGCEGIPCSAIITKIMNIKVAIASVSKQKIKLPA